MYNKLRVDLSPGFKIIHELFPRKSKLYSAFTLHTDRNRVFST